MSSITVQDIQQDPLAFLLRVEAGESFIVVKGEHPLAEVRPVATLTNQPRPYGLCAGHFKVPSGFDDPLPEQILKRFEGT